MTGALKNEIDHDAWAIFITIKSFSTRSHVYLRHDAMSTCWLCDVSFAGS